MLRDVINADIMPVLKIITTNGKHWLKLDIDLNDAVNHFILFKIITTGKYVNCSLSLKPDANKMGEMDLPFSALFLQSAVGENSFQQLRYANHWDTMNYWY